MLSLRLPAERLPLTAASAAMSAVDTATHDIHFFSRASAVLATLGMSGTLVPGIRSEVTGFSVGAMRRAYPCRPVCNNCGPDPATVGPYAAPRLPDRPVH